MRTSSGIFLAALLLAFTTAFAQTPNDITPAPSDTPILHVGTQLVVADVTVTDRNSHPIHGLKREDFTLTESKQPHTVNHFEEHSS